MEALKLEPYTVRASLSQKPILVDLMPEPQPTGEQAVSERVGISSE